MCGIVGIVAKSSESPNELLLYDAAQRLAHRGPEGFRSRQLGPALFGHTSLTFLHPGYSTQPLRTNDRLLISFNGELFNARTAIEQRTLGIDPAVDDEAEVIAALYRRFGLEGFLRLEGMFAVALFDARRQRLVLARDRLAKKPLYYTQTSEGVAFASELTALMILRDGPYEINPTGLASLLTCNVVLPPNSLVDGIQQVPAASTVEFLDGKMTVQKYWRPKVQQSLETTDNKGEELRHLLSKAVHRRLSDAIPYGVLLSGGLDSSIICGFSRIVRPQCPLPCFSLRFDRKADDETAYATSVAEYNGCDLVQVDASMSSLATAVAELTDRIDEPVIDWSLPALFLAARAASEAGVKAVLTGDGADEFFAGYSAFALQKLIGGRRSEAAALLCARAVRGTLTSLNRYTPGVERILEGVINSINSPPEWRFARASGAMLPDELADFLSPELLRRIEWDTIANVDGEWWPSLNPSSLDRLQAGVVSRFLPMILQKLDRVTMLNSIEARSPFLDEKVVEWSLQLPVAKKTRRLTTKTHLREIASSLVPRATLNRRKRGIRMPVAELLEGPLSEWVDRHLCADALTRVGVFREPAVTRSRLAFAQTRRRAKCIWALAFVQAWLVRNGVTA